MKEIIVSYQESGDKDDRGCIMGEWVGELIRCKDCKYYDYFSEQCRNGIDGIMTPNFYCANGERKDES